MQDTKAETDKYYRLLDVIRADKDFRKTLAACTESWKYLPSLIVECKKMTDNNTFDIIEIPAIEVAAKYYAVLNENQKLNELQKAIEPFPELENWLEIIDDARVVLDLANRIYKECAQNDGVLQKQLKNILEIDGNEVGNIVYYMTKVGRISKQKEGNSNRLKVAIKAEA